MTQRPGIGLPTIYLIALVALALTVWGASSVARYIWATAPAAQVASSVGTTGTVTARREERKGSTNNYFPNAKTVQYLAFAFMDRDGRPQSGEDEVSAIYYQDHEVGSAVEVFYLAEHPNRSVIGSAERLAYKVSAIDIAVGALALVAGGIALVWALNRWLIVRRGFGFL